MGFLWFESFGTEDNAIIKEIAKVHKVDPEKVAEAYKNMLEELKDETKE